MWGMKGRAIMWAARLTWGAARLTWRGVAGSAPEDGMGGTRLTWDAARLMWGEGCQEDMGVEENVRWGGWPTRGPPSL